MSKRLLSSGDDDNSVNVAATNAFSNALYVNAIIFIILVTFFELNRTLKSIYFKRVKKKFQVRSRYFCIYLCYNVFY